MNNSYKTIDIDTIQGNSEIKSFQHIYRVNKYSNLKKWITIIGVIMIAILFLPWTQNIKAKGYVTTLRQEDRPQEINSVIAGKINKWYIKEGDYVQKGDTIALLDEIKVEYMDPELLQKTKDQLQYKQAASDGYQGKANTSVLQKEALIKANEYKLQSLDNKLKQQYYKVESDSMDVMAATNDFNIYKRQIEAAKAMLDKGVISLTEFEKRKSGYQSAVAKKTSAENKLLQDKKELENILIDKKSVIQDYNDKIAKADGDKYASLSQISSTAADISKLENTYNSYTLRNKLYYITAPQNGQIIQAKKGGVGEIVKEGEMLAEIVPDNPAYAIEMFVEPMNLPLVSKGQKVSILFDGFPSIVFSGWPNTTYGTFKGVISSIESNINDKGKYRILIQPNDKEKKWPTQIKPGIGAYCITLLKDVPIYYEIWRNINGFPPEYYVTESADKNKADAKKKK